MASSLAPFGVFWSIAPSTCSNAESSIPDGNRSAHEDVQGGVSITIGYVPDKKILGLSKLSRIAGYFARRFQNQERTAHLIAVFIEQIVEPLGVEGLIDGQHMCALARGVRDTHSITKVNVMHGAFQKDQHLRNEFLARLS